MTSRSLPISELVTLVFLTGLVIVLSLAGCTTRTQSAEETPAVVTSAPREPAIVQIPVTAPEPVQLIQVAAAREVSYEDAENAYTERDFGRAADLFTRYTDRKPSNPWGHYMLGLSAWKSGALDTAELAFREAILLDSSHVKSWQNLSRVLLDAGRPEDAHRALREADRIEPGQGITFRLFGRAFHQEGDLESAADQYREAIRVDDTDVWSINNLGLVLMDEGLYGQALPTLARAVQLRPGQAAFQNNLGMALEHVGQARAAEIAYAEAVRLDEDHARADANLTRIMSVRQALDVEPADLDALAAEFVAEIKTWSDESVAREATLDVESELIEVDSDAGN
jgi:tetratricopeptide (TPR) repeat protein